MALSHAILAALLERPLSGYDLAKQFDASIGFFWQATHQQIYLELAKLESKDFLRGSTAEQTSRRTRILYSVTDAGVDHLAQWAAAPSGSAIIKDDILVKCHALSVTSASGLRAQIAERRGHHQARLDTYRKALARLYPNPRDLAGTALGQYLSLRAGVRYETSWLDWADEACVILPAED